MGDVAKATLPTTNSGKCTRLERVSRISQGTIAIIRREATAKNEEKKSTYVRQLVEASEELVEESDELLRRAL